LAWPVVRALVLLDAELNHTLNAATASAMKNRMSYINHLLTYLNRNKPKSIAFFGFKKMKPNRIFEN